MGVLHFCSTAVRRQNMGLVKENNWEKSLDK